jgi:hypothetical protein
MHIGGQPQGPLHVKTRRFHIAAMQVQVSERVEVIPLVLARGRNGN